MKSKTIAVLFFLGTLSTLDGLGHVGVFPRTGTAGARHQFFSVRAPVEKEIPTTELKIEIPPAWKAAGGQVDRVQYISGWQVKVERDEDDWIKSITWWGGEAPEWAYISFGMIITLPDLTGMQQIKAFQKYSDDSVVAWVEDRDLEDTEKPAAGLLLTEGGGHGPSMLTLGLSGLVGGLIGAGLMLVVSRSGRKGSS